MVGLSSGSLVAPLAGLSAPRMASVASKAFDEAEGGLGATIGLSPEIRELLCNSPAAAGKASRAVASSPEKAAAKVYSKALLAVTDLQRMLVPSLSPAPDAAAGPSVPAAPSALVPRKLALTATVPPVQLQDPPTGDSVPVTRLAVTPSFDPSGAALAPMTTGVLPQHSSQHAELLAWSAVCFCCARLKETYSTILIYFGIFNTVVRLGRRFADVAFTLGVIYLVLRPEMFVKIICGAFRLVPLYAEYAYARMWNQLQLELGWELVPGFASAPPQIQPQAFPLPPQGSGYPLVSYVLGGISVLIARMASQQLQIVY